MCMHSNQSSLSLFQFIIYLICLFSSLYLYLLILLTLIQHQRIYLAFHLAYCNFFLRLSLCTIYLFVHPQCSCKKIHNQLLILLWGQGVKRMTKEKMCLQLLLSLGFYSIQSKLKSPSLSQISLVQPFVTNCSFKARPWL